jgi:hypothetical protein
MNCRTAFYEDSGLLAISPCKIMKNYLTTWLFIDVASCLPITYLAMLQDSLGDGTESEDDTKSSGSSTKAIKILRMLRLAKLLRVFRFKRLLERYDVCSFPPPVAHWRPYCITLPIQPPYDSHSCWIY